MSSSIHEPFLELSPRLGEWWSDIGDRIDWCVALLVQHYSDLKEPLNINLAYQDLQSDFSWPEDLCEKGTKSFDLCLYRYRGKLNCLQNLTNIYADHVRSEEELPILFPGRGHWIEKEQAWQQCSRHGHQWLQSLLCSAATRDWSPGKCCTTFYSLSSIMLLLSWICPLLFRVSMHVISCRLLHRHCMAYFWFNYTTNTQQYSTHMRHMPGLWVQDSICALHDECHCIWSVSGHAQLLDLLHFVNLMSQTFSPENL